MNNVGYIYMIDVQRYSMKKETYIFRFTSIRLADQTQTQKIIKIKL